MGVTAVFYMPKLGLFAYINATTGGVAIKDGKLVLSKGNTTAQVIDIEYKNDTRELAKLKDAKLYIPGKVEGALVPSVDVNPGETKKLGLDLSVKASELGAGEYTVNFLLDGKLQDETLTVVVLDNDVSVKKVTVAGVEATEDDGTWTVQLPYGVKAENVTVTAANITLNSDAAEVIDFTKVDDETYTFKVKAEDETESELQTIELAETTIDADASSVSVAESVDADGNTLVTVTVIDTNGNPVKGLAESVFTVKAGTAGSEEEVDILEFVALVGSNAGTYEITVEGDITEDSVLVDVDGVELN